MWSKNTFCRDISKSWMCFHLYFVVNKFMWQCHNKAGFNCGFWATTCSIEVCSREGFWELRTFFFQIFSSRIFVYAILTFLDNFLTNDSIFITFCWNLFFFSIFPKVPLLILLPCDSIKFLSVWIFIWAINHLKFEF